MNILSEKGGRFFAAKGSRGNTSIETSENKKIDIQKESQNAQAVVVEGSDEKAAFIEELNKQSSTGSSVKKVEEEKANFSFVAIGDAESYKNNTGFNVELAEVMKKSKTYNPDFALFTGDIITASGANDAENRSRIENAVNVIQEQFNNYYIVFGKHDIECGTKCVEFWNEVLFDKKASEGESQTLFHSFDYLNTHFVLLSTNYPDKHSIDEKQLTWLEEDLSGNTKKNTIVVQHVPPVTFFSKSAKQCHDMSCSGDVQRKLLDIFKKHKVDLVISGHEHAFDHKIVDGTHFVLSGSCGKSPRYKGVTKGDIFTLFNINDGNITLKALNTEGRVIREIGIK